MLCVQANVDVVVRACAKRGSPRLESHIRADGRVEECVAVAASIVEVVQSMVEALSLHFR